MRASARVTGTVALVGLLAAVLAGGWWWARGAPALLPFGERCEATAARAVADLDPEQAGNAALITTIAVRRELPARAASIAIATAMQESKLRNLEYGDRDSLGLFQQRPSQGWGTADQVLDPVYAANAFYDRLVKIDGFESMSITKVAQRIQRSAFPQAYAQHEPQARILASALSGYSTASFSCRLHELPAGTGSSAPSATGLKKLLEAAGRETGHRAGPATASGTASGTATFTVSGGQARREGWSLAQWAVARASDLRIVAVQTDGRGWSRDQPDGWQRTTGGPAAGVVRVTVAQPVG